ncbi:methyltransferase domain-containing protein [Sungkyunkwania multivorans]|uniref:Methyltransferase domain-containing protein n=1 Tax=Sungkyunkwania multivorans TaxID=1173618 RepID=A0ABW3CWJ3_9FLAO
MAIDTTYRSNEDEIMDDFSIQGKELEDALQKITRINQFLGGYTVTTNGVKVLLEDFPIDSPVTIVDIGCGDGSVLKKLSKYNPNFKLIGIDANPFTIECALNNSKKNTIQYKTMDVFSTPFEDLDYDIALLTLTLHHFSDEQIVKLLKTIKSKARIGIVINDLQRSKLAYRLFQGICSIFRIGHMPREDGLTSILRGFKREDLENYSKVLDLPDYRIRWRWAFRWQWIIRT